MKLHEDSGSFIPDQHSPNSQARTSAFGPTRRFWRAPAIATSTAVVAALCLYTGSAAHAAGKPAAAKVSALSLQPAAAAQTTGPGGVHGAFDLYQGAGGGIEFWFDPGTGLLTVAIGTGTGALGGGVLGTYAYGTAPAAGTYLYADATLSAGTVVTVNLSGTYTLVNGVFRGSVSATVEGRTLTITSDGSSVFKASVTIVHGASGWSSPNYGYTYYFSLPDIIEFIYPPIEFPTPYPHPDPDPNEEYTHVASDAGGATTIYADSTGTDGSVVSDGTTDDSSSSSSDDSSDDSSSGDDSGGGGGGGGTSDDDGAPIMEE